MDLNQIYNLLIALIAIDFTLYGIGIPFFQSQLGINVRYLKKRLDETREQLKKLNESDKDVKDNLQSMQDTINKYKKEESNFVFKLYFLTYQGAVLLPLLFFSISLILIILEQNLKFNIFNFIIIYNNNLILNDVEILIIISLLIGAYLETLTLKAIDFAVKTVPLPIFEVTFNESKISLDITGGVKQTISLNVTNVGYDVAELFQVMMLINPDFIINPSKNYDLIRQDSNASVYPSYTGVTFDADYLHIGTTLIFEIMLTPPNKIEKYKVGVFINEKKNTETEVELELNINQTTTKTRKKKTK